MGVALSAPVELVHVQRNGTSDFRCAVAEMQGWRVAHEDAHAMALEGPVSSFFVLDGHGGHNAAQQGAPRLGPQCLGSSTLSDGLLPDDPSIIESFKTVDEELRAAFREKPDQESGTTVIGALVASKGDGTYSAKIVNAGDSRGILVHGPGVESSVASPSVRIPEHLDALKAAEAAARTEGEEEASLPWPLIAESTDHKPSHPTERGRILAAGGFVTDEEPPRVDGNLAVSRGLGDFEFKSNADKPVPEQKVSCIPDVYEVSGLPHGTILVLACDGIWDVMSSQAVAVFVRERLAADAAADLGDICADLIAKCLAMDSKDNMTAMIVQFVDGTEYASSGDEMKNFHNLAMQSDEDMRKHYTAFLASKNFPLEPIACESCHRWRSKMQQCPCKAVYYCDRQCQKRAWKTHKRECSMAGVSEGGSPKGMLPGSPSAKVKGRKK